MVQMTSLFHDRVRRLTSRVSLGRHARQGDLGSGGPAISADGRFVAFRSGATNLVTGDTNGQTDIFVRDRRSGITTRASVGPNGRQADAGSYNVSISATGRYIAFSSVASNLAPNNFEGAGVFVRDRVRSATSLVSIGRNQTPANGNSFEPIISATGRFVAFNSGASNLMLHDTNDANDIFVRDLHSKVTRRVSVSSGGKEGNLESGPVAAISGDGRFVAFASVATNLVPNDNNQQSDIFLHDLRTLKTIRISVGTRGAEADSGSYLQTMSVDGRYTAFISTATNLVPDGEGGREQVYVFDRIAETVARVDIQMRGVPLDGGQQARPVR